MTKHDWIDLAPLIAICAMCITALVVLLDGQNKAYEVELAKIKACQSEKTKHE